MTELYINGVSAVLPNGFNVQVKRENPLITKNGEYSYDITLPLDNSVNAALYKHLNRLNSVSEISGKRNAILMSGNRVYCSGTEVITGWTDTTVSIQLVSGNSELNYFIGSGLMISFLDMKETNLNTGDSNSDTSNRINGIDKLYPEVDACTAPVMNRASGEIINNWAFFTSGNTLTLEANITAEKNEFYAQPYLCAYIKEVLRAIGYDLTYNFLDDTPFSQLYICHVEKTGKWNELLPGWSVQEFLEQVEQMFNAIFLIDQRKRTARLFSRVAYYHGSSSVHVAYTEDAYEAEVEDETEGVQMGKANVDYDFPDNAYWRSRRIPEAILKLAKKETVPKEFAEEGFMGILLSPRMYNWFQNAEHQRKDVLYTDELTGRQFIYQNVLHPYEMVNDFPALEREGDAEAVELEMMPVELARVMIPGYIYDEKHHTYVNNQNYNHYLPVLDGENDNEESNEEISLPDLIEEGVTEDSEESKGKIFLAFYAGVISHTTTYPAYPVSYTDEYLCDGYQDVMLVIGTGASLRLSYLDQTLYNENYDIDFSKGIKLSSHDPNIYDPQSIFEIRNKRYICKELEFTLDANGRKGAWTGTFYPIRIADTEADARWILTDGKWRDGGVWLDNGRWLDE